MTGKVASWILSKSNRPTGNASSSCKDECPNVVQLGWTHNNFFQRWWEVGTLQSHPTLCNPTDHSIAHQALLSMELFMQELLGVVCHALLQGRS